MSGIVESAGNCPECLGSGKRVGAWAVCHGCKTRWGVDGAPPDLEAVGDQLKLVLAGYREVQPARVLQDNDNRSVVQLGDGTPDGNGYAKREVEGRLTEEVQLKFSDGSRLEATFAVKAGARPHLSQAAAFVERLRRVIGHDTE